MPSLIERGASLFARLTKEKDQQKEGALIESRFKLDEDVNKAMLEMLAQNIRINKRQHDRMLELLRRNHAIQEVYINLSNKPLAKRIELLHDIIGMLAELLNDVERFRKKENL